MNRIGIHAYRKIHRAKTRHYSDLRIKTKLTHQKLILTL